MANINLAPSNEYQVAAERRQCLLFIASGVIIAGLFITWVIVFVLIKQTERSNTDRQTRRATVETAIAELSDDAKRITLFEQRLSAMNSLLQQHITLDPLLREVERLVPTGTVFGTELIQVDGARLLVTGITPDLEQLVQTIASFSNKPSHTTLFKRVDLKHTERHDSSDTTPVTYGFNLDIGFDATQLKNKY